MRRTIAACLILALALAPAHAQLTTTGAGSAPGGGGNPNAPSLILNFTSTPSLDTTNLTPSGGTNGTVWNSAGNLVATAAPRFTYDPVTHAARGLLIEGTKTNSIANNTMVGGGPGTLPTGWFIDNSNGAGVALSVVGVGVVNGISYVTVRAVGTATASGWCSLYFGPMIAAAAAQTWAVSAYFSLAAGSLSNGDTTAIGFDANTSVPAYISSPVSQNFTPTNASLAGQRQSGAAATPASTAFVYPWMTLSLNPGFVDVTLNVGLPQMEQSEFATSPILTSGSAATRTGDQFTTIGTAQTILAAAAGSSMLYMNREGAKTVAPVAQAAIYSTAGSGAQINTNQRLQTNGVTQITLAGGSTPGAPEAIGLSWSAAGRTLAGTGAAVATDANTAWNGQTTFTIGSNGGSQWTYGVLTQLLLWNSRVPDTVLNAYAQSQ